MPSFSPSTADILKRAEDTLKTAKDGLKDLTRGPQERKLSGLRNLTVFGRAVTNILQNLRSTEPDFDIWYKRYKEEMRDDPLMNYFYKLRSKILKEGSLGTSTQVGILQLRIPQDLARFGPPPPNAVGFFIGDNIGGTGWEIKLPDGSVEKYYVELPHDIGFADAYFRDAPNYHQGQKIKDTSIPNLGKMYIEYLSRLVASAKETFKEK